MTRSKHDVELTSRLTAYVTRGEGAAELRISPSTWDELVQAGQLPKPILLGKSGSLPRWRWADVDKKLRGDDAQPLEHESYFRGSRNGQKADGGRHAA
jgi:predicted DNA-binding transcriptional regulator AlpA